MQTKIIAKAVLIGNSGSGKTKIIERLTDASFSYRPIKTVDATFFAKTSHNEDGSAATLQIWDTPGQEKLSTLGTQFYSDAAAFVLTIDSTKPFNAKEIQEWIREAQQKGQKAKFYIAVSKCDEDPYDYNFAPAQPHDDFKNQNADKIDEGKVKQNLKTATTGLIELDDDAIFFCSARKDRNIGNLFQKIANDAIQADKLAKESSKPMDFKPTLLERLNEYTSFGNKLIAGIKWFFSFGVFSLGMQKQELAERFKGELSKVEDVAKLNSLISEYGKINEELILEEHNQSGVFHKHYLAPYDSKNSFSTHEGFIDDLNLSKGEFGKILTSPNPQDTILTL